MRTAPQARMLPDCRRLHLHHGPIDLVVEAVGGTSEIGAAYEAATRRFRTILDELCAELPALRQAARPGRAGPDGKVARRMHAAVLPFANATFITPMAAVAGAVAEEVLAAMQDAALLRRASVNNGGDIAFHLAPGESLRVGLVDQPDRPWLFGEAVIRAGHGVRGMATSGWRGRSFSLGIADAVTILARTAAEADAAATVVANAVDLPGHSAVWRISASEVQCDSDLGDRLVTRGVGGLSPQDVEEALGVGVATAQDLISRGLIEAAALHLQGRTEIASDRRSHWAKALFRASTRVESPERNARPTGGTPTEVSGKRRSRLPSPLAGEGGPAKQGRMRGHVGGHPSSVIAPRCHLLPQGEKGIDPSVVSQGLGAVQ